MTERDKDRRRREGRETEYCTTPRDKDSRVLFTRFARIPRDSLARDASHRYRAYHIIVSHRIVSRCANRTNRPSITRRRLGATCLQCARARARTYTYVCACALLRAPVCATCLRVCARCALVFVAVECKARVCIRDGSMFHCRRDAASSPVVAGRVGSPRKEVSQVERGRLDGYVRSASWTTLRKTRGKFVYYTLVNIILLENY